MLESVSLLITMEGISSGFPLDPPLYLLVAAILLFMVEKVQLAIKSLFNRKGITYELDSNNRN